MKSLEDEIPGLKEAEARARLRENELRQTTWLPIAPAIYGVPVLPLTLRHFTSLHAVGSPLVVMQAPYDFETCMQFLWIVSPDHLYPTPWVSLREAKKARKTWIDKYWPRLRRRKLGALSQAILDYVEVALFDLERSEGSGVAPVTHFNASIVDEFAEAYGWSDEELDARGLPIFGKGIRDKPLAQLIQMRRARTVRKFPDACLSNPLSDNVAPRMLRELIVKEREEAARKEKP